MSLAVWRAATPHENKLKAHLNKPRGGANAVNVALDDVPSEAQDLAVRAAICLDRQIAGIDLVQDKVTGKWYILEVNNDPQIRGGSFVPAKAAMVAKYFEAELNQ
jgi:D-alanine-D-alanine ligase-like ATP-grasp enzyme